MLKIVTARAYSGKTTYMINEIMQNKDILSYFMVPEQLTLETEKMILNLAEKPIFLCKVMSFDRLSLEVLSKAGGIKKDYIDDIDKIMLTENILLENKEEFILYKNAINKSGFIENVIKIISEFKKYLVNTDDLLNFAAITQDKLLSQKIKEIVKIYHLLEEKIKDRFIDNEYRLNLLCEKIQDYSKIKKFKVYIDNFVSFTTLELNVIEKLLQNNIDLTVSLSYEQGYDSSFHITKSTLDSLIDIAIKSAVKYEIIHLEKSYNNIPDLKHLEKNFGKYDFEKYEEVPQNIHILRSDNAKEEIKNVAKIINSLIREKGYRYKDIAVVVTDSIGYAKHIKEEFDIYDIPNFIDVKRDVSRGNIVNLILSFIDMFINSPNYTNIMSFFKSGLSDIKKSDYEIFENYLINWNMDGQKFINNKFFENEEYFKGGFEEEKNKICEIKNYIMNLYDKYKPVFKKKNEIKIFSNHINDFLKELACQEKLENLIEELKQNAKFEIASEISQIWNLILSTLDKMNTILEGYEIDIAKYKKMFYQGLNTQKIALIPPTIDSVMVMDIQRSKSLGYKVLFIAGMNDTLLPKSISTDIIFNEKDKRTLIENNIKLNSTAENILNQEKTALYTIISKVREKLYLSYAIVDVNAQSSGKSPYISTIENIFPKLDISRKNIELKDENTTLKELFNQMKSKLAFIKDEQDYDENTLKLYKYFLQSEEFGDRAETIEKAMFVKNNMEKIQEVEKIYNLPLTSSISQIQTYLKCPFSHYMKYAIKPKKRNRQSIDKINSGNILHKYMEKFSQELLENKELLNLKTKQDIEKIVDNVYSQEDFLDNNIKIIVSDSKRQENILRKLKKISKKATDFILTQQQNSSFEIVSYEKEIKNIQINLDGDNPKDKIILRGYIDRVDEIQKDGKTYVGVVDYKSSVKKLELKDIYQGINIQMIFYLYALTEMQQDKEPYYAMYFPMIDAKTAVSEQESRDIELIEKKIQEKMKMEGIITDDLNMIKAFENNIDIEKKSKFIDVSIKSKKDEGENLSGQSVVSEKDMKLIIKHIIKIIQNSAKEILEGNINPKPLKDSCTYCDYKNICAFDESIENFEYKKIQKFTKDEVLEKLI